MNYLSVYIEKDKSTQNTILRLSFTLNDRKFNMSRLATEPVGKTLKRIGISVEKTNTKGKDGAKKKNKKQDALNNVPVALFLPNGEQLDSEIPNLQAWKERNVLNIVDCKFVVEENTPMVSSCRIPSVIMASFPVVPTIKLEFADRANSQFKWFKNDLSTCEGSQFKSMGSEVDVEPCEMWSEVGQDFIYIPTVGDIGCKLRMSCKAASVGKAAHEWFDVTAVSEVEAGPGVTPFDTCHLYTTKSSVDSSLLRVVSYNILADCYLEDEATCEAWFGYCPKYALAIDYRRQILLKEIVGYHGDIVCLQECGHCLFDDYLNPMMASEGYIGVVRYKSGIMREGEAIFFKNSMFTLLSEHNFELRDSLVNDACNKELLQNVQAVPEVYEKLRNRTTVAQIAVLRHNKQPQNYVCVVNTHLYFRPNAHFIRNLQTMIVLNYLKKTIDQLEIDLVEIYGTSYQVGVLLCGDFNSLPGSGVVKLLSDGTLPSYHHEWNLPLENQRQFTCRLEVPSYSQQFNFQNCCGFPEFTTFTEGFSGVIDYIFASQKCFEVKYVFPMPSKEELQLYTAIPSPVMASDHLALICELKWK